MVALFASAFLQFLFHQLRLSPRSLPSTPPGNRRDIFSDPILRTCSPPAPLPYRARVCPARVSSEHEACPHPPIPRRNASAQGQGRYFPPSRRQGIAGF